MTTSNMGTWAAATRLAVDDPVTIALIDQARRIQADQERRDGRTRSARVTEIETMAVAIYLARGGA